MAGNTRQVQGTGSRIRRRPVLAAAQRRRGHQHAVRRRQHGSGERLGRVEPAAVDRDVIFAPVHPLDRQPVDELRVGLTADPGEQRNPCGERLTPPREAANRTFDPRPCL